jgi:P4 family phage/plasmid primase-like protien
MEACTTRFHDPKFEEKLDDNPFLVGFENGVYDLESGYFRKGTPDDYITLSVGYDYIEFDENDIQITEICEFFDKVMREKDMRNYIFTLLSSYLDGRCKDQNFILWTGSGCHAKGTGLILYDGTIKNVEDIKITDKLMGNDSTPRTVKQLFRGVDDMYEIIPSIGESYIVNKEHRLALKFVGDTNIYYDDNKYIYDWYEFDNYGGIVKKEKSIESMNHNQNLYDELEKFSQKNEKNNENFIQKDHILIVKVNKFLELSKNIRQLFHAFKCPINSDILLEKDIINENNYNDNLNCYEILVENDNTDNLLFSANTHGYFTHKIVDGNKNIVQIYTNTYSVPIDIKYVGKDNYYGFELSDNGSYLLHDCTRLMNSNGKSTAVDLMSYTLGDYFGVLPTTVITKKRGSSSNATPELADKRGKRLLVIQEPEHDDVIYVGNMKQLTGGDWVEARALYGMPFMYKPQFKLLLTCNKLPHIPSHDGGTWRRLRVSPWESEFVDGEPELPHQYPKDRELGDKLKTWGPAFIWILLNKYYPIYKASGLNTPLKVTQHTEKYKKDTDTYLEFLVDYYIITKDEKDSEPLNIVYNCFKDWYQQAYSSKPPPRKDFVNYLTDYKYKIVNGEIKGLKYKSDV